MVNFIWDHLKKKNIQIASYKHTQTKHMRISMAYDIDDIFEVFIDICQFARTEFVIYNLIASELPSDDCNRSGSKITDGSLMTSHRIVTKFLQLHTFRRSF